MRWLGMTSFPKGPQLWSCPVWTKKIINLSTNPFRLKMRFQKRFAKCSPIPWEQVQRIFPIRICKIILSIFIYFYEHLSLHEVSLASSAPLLDDLCSNPTERWAASCFYSLINGCRRLHWLLLGCKGHRWRKAFWLGAGDTVEPWGSWLCLWSPQLSCCRQCFRRCLAKPRVPLLNEKRGAFWKRFVAPALIWSVQFGWCSSNAFR